MPFRLRRDTRSWFRDLESDFELDFDMYHLCLVAGLADKRKTEMPDSDTTVLVENFPGDYRSFGRVIVGFFLTVELEVLGVEGANRESLNRTINRLVDPGSQSYLSNEGMRAINQYSYGGFEVISEWFEDRPRTFGGFFPRYHDRVGDLLGELSPSPF